MNDGADVIARLGLLERRAQPSATPQFVLMEHLTGIEMGVGAYFNGEEFLEPVCLDWEHKRFFPGDLGELTGEMGTLVTYRNAGKLFDATLARMQPVLRADGYCGYVNLNTIVNEAGIWPLEFTCRFGYPGFAILDALHTDGWDVILRAMCSRETRSFGTRDGYAIGVVLTVPPFPYPHGYAELSKGAPISFRNGMQSTDDALHFGEVATRDGQLVTDGTNGYVMVVTGSGASTEAAQASAYASVGNVVIANVRYRRDIGDRFVAQDRRALVEWGFLP
jgi:phosphoribosylamine--glycine ligase